MSATQPDPITQTLTVSEFVKNEIWRPRFTMIDYTGLSPKLQIDPAAILHEDGPVRIEITLDLPASQPFVFVPKDAGQPALGVAVRTLSDEQPPPEELVRVEWVDFPTTRRQARLVIDVPAPGSPVALPAVSALHIPGAIEDGTSFFDFYADKDKAALADVQGGLYLALTSESATELSDKLCPPDATAPAADGEFTVTGFDECGFPIWNRFGWGVRGRCSLEIEPAFRLSNAKTQVLEIRIPRHQLKYERCTEGRTEQSKVRVLAGEKPAALPAELQSAEIHTEGDHEICRLVWRRGDERPSRIGRVVAFTLPVLSTDNEREVGEIDPTVIEPPPCTPRACTS